MSMSSLLRGSLSLGAPLCLFCAFLIAITEQAPEAALASHNEQENLAYVNEILGYLNNNYECILPTFEQVDELHRRFEELKIQWGIDYQKKLTPDQRLVLQHVLDDWEAFRSKYHSTIVIRSAIKRWFLCRIEDYQSSKFNSSVCTRLKNIRGPVSDHIFKTNPHVRYLEHLETGVVVERPESQVVVETPKRETAFEQPIQESVVEDAKPKVSGEQFEPEAMVEHGSPGNVEAKEDSTLFNEEEPSNIEDEAEQTVVVEDKGESKVSEEKADISTEGNLQQAVSEKESALREVETTSNLKPATVSEEDCTLVKAETEMRDVKHNFIGEFSFEFDEMPDRIVLTIERDAQPQIDTQARQDSDRDPLAEIPNAVSDDEDDEDSFLEAGAGLPEGAASSSEVEPKSSRAPTTTTPLSQFDEFGAEFIEAECDDADLARLARVPKSDWQFDPIYGNFKWPDESQLSTCPVLMSPPLTGEAAVQVELAELPTDQLWAEFVADPYGIDTKLNKPSPPKRERPKISAAQLRKKQKNFYNKINVDQMFGWAPAEIETPFEPVMPEIKRDRWRHLANNNYCKIGLNQAKIVASTKSGYKAAKMALRSGGESLAIRIKVLRM